MTDWSDDYKAKVRDFIAERGRKIQVVKHYEWQEDDDVSPYGWNDYKGNDHCTTFNSKYNTGGGCHWVVPEGASLYERVYSEFNGTDADNLEVVGVNVKGCHCACGKYTDVILRWQGSVTEMLHVILGMPNQRMEVEL